MLSRLCIHGIRRINCPNECKGSKLCIHGKFKPLCRIEGCGGGSLCVHGKRRTRCNQGCGGGSLCVHGKQKSFCRVPGCGGGSYCVHGKQRSHCKQGCGGGSLCTHGRRRKTCQKCAYEDKMQKYETSHKTSSAITKNDETKSSQTKPSALVFSYGEQYADQWFWCLSDPAPPWEIDILDPKIGWNFD